MLTAFAMKTIIESLESHFDNLHFRTIRLLSLLRSETLYLRSDPLRGDSCGDHILRAAAAVEQAFGGITSRLWDDPFEWTLPEQYPSPESIVQYLEEVLETRRAGFRYFQNDLDLLKQIPAPLELRSIFDVLRAAADAAEDSLGRATSVYLAVSNVEK